MENQFNDIFITNIHIDKVRHLENVDILLSEKEKKHLILTGKNGSGKTSLLEEMKNNYFEKFLIPLFKTDKNIINNYIKNDNIIYKDLNIILNIKFSEKFKEMEMVSVYIPAKRSLYMEQPMSIEKIIFDKKIDNDLSKDFLKYMIYLDYQIVTTENKSDEQHVYDWFDNLKKSLREIYDCPELEMKRVSKDLTFKIYMPNFEPFGLNEMSDGYASFLDVIQELILRMDNGYGIVDYNMPGIVLIDEIEAHLHVELQKQILPFLIKTFPNIQFIVSTHSPFVINSISNAVVYDLEKHIRVEDLSAYSYEGIIEYYFGKDMYSDEAKKMFEEYKILYERNQ